LKLERGRIMRKAVLLFLLICSLCGCSTIAGTEKNTLYPAWEGRKKEILTWAASEKTRVDKGTLKHSEYWEEFYRKSIEMRPDLDDFLFFSSEMIKVSRIFEEGRITKEQFEDKYRQLSALLAQEEDRRARMLSISGTYISENTEVLLFYAYRESLFLGYINDLRERLRAAGPQFASSHCAFFGDAIQCTTQNPPF